MKRVILFRNGSGVDGKVGGRRGGGGEEVLRSGGRGRRKEMEEEGEVDVCI